MEEKRHKHHRNHSPNDLEEYKKKKLHKRHHSPLSLSEEEEAESNRRKHHKHKRSKDQKHKQRSGSHEDSREPRNVSHHSRNHKEDYDRDSAITDHTHSRHNSSDRNAERRGHHSRHHRYHSQRSSTEFDPLIRIKQEKDDSNFHEQQRERQGYNQRRRDARRERDRAGGDHGLNTEAPTIKSEPSEGSPANAAGKENAERQQPNFELSGKLTEDTNTFRGVVIKYNEPPEAMMPKRRWRLYPFKGQESLPVLHIHRQSAFLLGRDRRIADIPVDHPSCSKQQAVLQFRAMPYTRSDGTPGRRVRPYIIDLESANGTFLNGEKIEARRYYELREKDVIKFGFSSREYVLLHDSVDTSEVAAGEDIEEA